MKIIIFDDEGKPEWGCKFDLSPDCDYTYILDPVYDSLKPFTPSDPAIMASLSGIPSMGITEKPQDGGAAFPGAPGDYGVDTQSGMSLRVHAAIELRVPESGIDWLDQMIVDSIVIESKREAILEAAKDAEDGLESNEPICLTKITPEDNGKEK